jgi:hypothetical protein
VSSWKVTAKTVSKVNDTNRIFEFTGTLAEGTPTGSTSTFGGVECYFARPTGKERETDELF